MDRIQVSVGKSNQLGQRAAVHSKFYFLLQIIVTRRDKKKEAQCWLFEGFSGIFANPLRHIRVSQTAEVQITHYFPKLM